VPFVENTEWLQAAGNMGPMTALPAEQTLRSSSAPVESQTPRQLAESSTYSVMDFGYHGQHCAESNPEGIETKLTQLSVHSNYDLTNAASGMRRAPRMI
jgi:hypothetical protein